ncbi:nucleotide-binding protein [Nonomuraea angiospora]|uniref:nucleotide-binding protein n=1 Tax=Nonomuraea angiospora TaxID=46172 RepID=UPI0029A777F8|nr:AAA family ATPase [Nonomuraea angiospora]MDX3099748.1 AAA family ATPase [Nonomuraea angiospora]
MARHDREESLEEQLAWLDAIKETEEAPVSVSASTAAADEPVASPYPQDPWRMVPTQPDTPTPPLFRAAVDSVYGAAAAEDLPDGEMEAAEWLGTASAATKEPPAFPPPSPPRSDDPFHAPLKPLPRPDDTDTYALSFTPPEPSAPSDQDTQDTSWSSVPEWARAPEPPREEPEKETSRAEPAEAEPAAKKDDEPASEDTSPKHERPQWPDPSDTLPTIQPPKWSEPAAAKEPEPEERPSWSADERAELSWPKDEPAKPSGPKGESTEPPWLKDAEPSWPKDAESSWPKDAEPLWSKDAEPSWPKAEHAEPEERREERPSWSEPAPQERSSWSEPAQEERSSWSEPAPQERSSWSEPTQQERPSWSEPAQQEEEPPPPAEQHEWRPAEREIPPPSERRRRPAPIPVFNAPPRPPITGRPTADSLDPESLLRGRRNAPSKGWRRLIYKASGGWIKPGEPPEVRRRRELVSRARTPVTAGHHRVAVLSLKGGVGKTTTTVGLGATLAQVRGDRVIAVDANPDRGTLSDKLVLETSATVRDLLNERDQVKRYVDIRAFTSQAPSRLEVLASDRDPSVSEAFSGADYQAVSQVLENFYSICITDCGTGLLHSAMGGVLGLADQIVLVSSPSVDGARAASATLDWLEAHHYGDLVKNATVVLCSVRPRSKSAVDIKKLEAHFAARCRAVVRVPYDPHLEEGAEIDLDRLQEPTRDSYLQLAACVGDGFAGLRE